MSKKSGIIGLLGFAALAVVFQLTDAPVYEAVRFVSGHTLKHVCAGVAAWQIVQMLTRDVVATTDGRKRAYEPETRAVVG